MAAADDSKLHLSNYTILRGGFCLCALRGTLSTHSLRVCAVVGECVCVCAGSGTLSRLLPAQAAPLPGQPDRSSGAVHGEPCGGSVLTSSLKFERHHLRKIRMRALTHSRRLDA